MASLVATGPQNFSIPFKCSKQLKCFKDVDTSTWPSGSYQLTAQLSNAGGETFSKSVAIVRDSLPELTLIEPAVGRVVTSEQILVRFDCQDDLGCVSWKVLAGNSGSFVMVASGNGPPPPQVVITGNYSSIRVSVKDTSQREITKQQDLLVNPVLKLVTHVASLPGPIMAADSTRAVFQTVSGASYKDLVTGTTTPLDVGSKITAAILTPNGAIVFAEALPYGTNDLYEWNGSELSYVDKGKYPQGTVDNRIEVLGNTGVWTTQTGLTIRNFATGNEFKFLAEPTSAEFAIEPDGDVVWHAGGNFSGNFQMKRTKPNGVTQNVVASALRPETDGQNLMYLRKGPGAQRLRVRGLGGDKLLAIFTLDTSLKNSQWLSYAWRSNSGFAAKDGWLAFPVTGPSGYLQIVRRSPQGDNEQLTITNQDHVVELMGTNGSCVFLEGNFYPVAQHRYLAVPGKPPIDLGRQLGEMIPEGENWRMTYGADIFLITPADIDTLANAFPMLSGDASAGSAPEQLEMPPDFAIEEKVDEADEELTSLESQGCSTAAPGWMTIITVALFFAVRRLFARKFALA